MMNTGIHYFGTQAIKHLATGEKYYRAIFQVHGRGRLSRKKFKRAWEAELYGRKIEVRCLRERSRERAARARLEVNGPWPAGG